MITVKTCYKCKRELLRTPEFWPRNKSKPDGLAAYCKPCSSAASIAYTKTPEGLASCKAYRQRYMSQIVIDPITGRETTRKAARSRQKAADNPLVKLRNSLRSLLRKSLGTKSSKTEKILQCSMLEFRAYIEGQFTEGMTWENQGAWHFDHRIPCAVAKTELELIALQHWSNFQPMWSIENISKGAAPPDGWALELRLLISIS